METKELYFRNDEGELLFLQPEQIISSRFNDFELCDIDVLIDSIRMFGLLQPLNVYPNGDGTYRLIAGERRKLAIMTGKERGIPWFTKGIPCYVGTKEDTELHSLDENIRVYEANIQSRDHHGNYLEKVKTLMTLYQKKQQKDENFPDNLMKYMAGKLGVGERQVQKITKIIRDGDHWVCNAIEEGSLALDKASRIIRLNPEEREELKVFYEEHGFLSDEVIDRYKNQREEKNSSKIIEPAKNPREKNTLETPAGDNGIDIPKMNTADDLLIPDDDLLRVYADPIYDEESYKDEDMDYEEYSDETNTNTEFPYEKDIFESGTFSERDSEDITEEEEDLMMRSSMWFKEIADRGECSDFEKLYIDGMIKSASKFYFPKFAKQGYIDDFMIDTIKEIVNTMLPLLQMK